MTLHPKNIIVRMPNWIGDLVMATPILSDLKRAFPEASLTVMCARPICELLEKDKEIDELFCFSRPKNSFTRRRENRNILLKLREGGYDLGVLLTNSFSSAWLFWQGQVTHRLGYKDHFRSLLLNLPVQRKCSQGQHLVTTYKQLLSPLGIPVSKTKPRLYLEEAEIKEAKELLYQRGYKEGKTLVGIHAGAAYGPAKRWPEERFYEVAKRLLEDPSLFVVFVGDASLEPVVKKLCLSLPSSAINLAGVTSLRELMCILKSCAVLLTNDSGPMHIASALGVPVVALFGSTSQVETGPYQNPGEVIDKKAACSPCFKRVCPIDFRCMKGISVEEVYKSVVDLLRKNRD